MINIYTWRLGKNNKRVKRKWKIKSASIQKYQIKKKVIHNASTLKKKMCKMCEMCKLWEVWNNALRTIVELATIEDSLQSKEEVDL